MYDKLITMEEVFRFASLALPGVLHWALKSLRHPRNLRAHATHSKLLKSEHRQFKTQVIQWTIYCAVYKLKNILNATKINRACHFVAI